MDLKRILILFLIFFFLPVVLGKISLAPFGDFFDNLSLKSFWAAFITVLKADWNFYLGWLAPWIEKLKDLIKGSIPAQL